MDPSADISNSKWNSNIAFSELQEETKIFLDSDSKREFKHHSEPDQDKTAPEDARALNLSITLLFDGLLFL